MNTEDIIRWARKAYGTATWLPDELARFAKLAYEAGAAAEREALAKYFEHHWRDRWTEKQIVDAIRARSNT